MDGKVPTAESTELGMAAQKILLRKDRFKFHIISFVVFEKEN